MSEGRYKQSFFRTRSTVLYKERQHCAMQCCRYTQNKDMPLFYILVILYTVNLVIG